MLQPRRADESPADYHSRVFSAWKTRNPGGDFFGALRRYHDDRASKKTATAERDAAAMKPSGDTYADAANRWLVRRGVVGRVRP